MDVSHPPTFTFAAYLPSPPVFCLHHDPSFSIVTECYMFSDFSFPYFKHYFAYNTPFPLTLPISMPSVVQCVTNYFPIILYTGIYSQ